MAHLPERVLLPRPMAAALPQAPPLRKRKRDRVAVACERCRKRKTKCNGFLPACAECSWAKVECQYATSDERSDSAALKELRDTYHNARGILDALRKGNQHESADLLHKLRGAENLDEMLSGTITPGASHYGPLTLLPNIANWFDAPAETHTPTHSPSVASCANRRSITPIRLPISRWTRVGGDDDGLTHIFMLFWAWDNKLTRVIHWASLLEDLCARYPPETERQEMATGTSFCSEFLVNAMLTVSSIFDNDRTASRWSSCRGRKFADEAYRLLEKERQTPSFPLIQGVALLQAYEEFTGNSHGANSLLQDLYRIHGTLRIFHAKTAQWGVEGSKWTDKVRQAVSFIAWGFYCLDAKMSLVCNTPMQIAKPQLPRAFPKDEPSEQGFGSMDDLWFPYPIVAQAQLSYHQKTINLECDFAELASRVLLQMEANLRCPVPDYRQTKDMYNQLLRWKNSVPPMLPSEIFLQLSIDMFAIKLLEPFTGLSFLNFDGNQTALSLSLFHSNTIIWTLWNYRTAYGMRHDYWMLHACWIAATTLLPHLTPQSSHAEPFRKSCELIYDIAEYLPLGNGFVSALEAEIARKGVDVPSSATRTLAIRSGWAGGVHIGNVQQVFEGKRAELGKVPKRKDVVFGETIMRVNDRL